MSNDPHTAQYFTWSHSSHISVQSAKKHFEAFMLKYKTDSYLITRKEELEAFTRELDQDPNMTDIVKKEKYRQFKEKQVPIIKQSARKYWGFPTSDNEQEQDQLDQAIFLETTNVKKHSRKTFGQFANYLLFEVKTLKIDRNTNKRLSQPLALMTCWRYLSAIKTWVKRQYAVEQIKARFEDYVSDEQWSQILKGVVRVCTDRLRKENKRLVNPRMANTDEDLTNMVNLCIWEGKSSSIQLAFFMLTLKVFCARASEAAVLKFQDFDFVPATEFKTDRNNVIRFLFGRKKNNLSQLLHVYPHALSFQLCFVFLMALNVIMEDCPSTDPHSPIPLFPKYFELHDDEDEYNEPDDDNGILDEQDLFLLNEHKSDTQDPEAWIDVEEEEEEEKPEVVTNELESRTEADEHSIGTVFAEPESPESGRQDPEALIVVKVEESEVWTNAEESMTEADEHSTGTDFSKPESGTQDPEVWTAEEVQIEEEEEPEVMTHTEEPMTEADEQRTITRRVKRRRRRVNGVATHIKHQLTKLNYYAVDLAEKEVAKLGSSSFDQPNYTFSKDIASHSGKKHGVETLNASSFVSTADTVKRSGWVINQGMGSIYHYLDPNRPYNDQKCAKVLSGWGNGSSSCNIEAGGVLPHLQSLKEEDRDYVKSVSYVLFGKLFPLSQSKVHVQQLMNHLGAMLFFRFFQLVTTIMEHPNGDWGTTYHEVCGVVNERVPNNPGRKIHPIIQKLGYAVSRGCQSRYHDNWFVDVFMIGFQIGRQFCADNYFGVPIPREMVGLVHEQWKQIRYIGTLMQNVQQHSIDSSIQMKTLENQVLTLQSELHSMTNSMTNSMTTVAKAINTLNYSISSLSRKVSKRSPIHVVMDDVSEEEEDYDLILPEDSMITTNPQDNRRLSSRQITQESTVNPPPVSSSVGTQFIDIPSPTLPVNQLVQRWYTHTLWLHKGKNDVKCQIKFAVEFVCLFQDKHIEDPFKIQDKHIEDPVVRDITSRAYRKWLANMEKTINDAYIKAIQYVNLQPVTRKNGNKVRISLKAFNKAFSDLHEMLPQPICEECKGYFKYGPPEENKIGAMKTHAKLLEYDTSPRKNKKKQITDPNANV